jgi:hypothetical protein
MQLVEQHVIDQTDPRVAVIDAAAFAATHRYHAALSAAVDLGVDTLAALTANPVGFAPRPVNGRPITSTHPCSSKRRAELPDALGHVGMTARRERLTTTRTRRSNHSLHAASTTLSALLGQEGSGTLVMGTHGRGKPEVARGRGNTQQCVQLPHASYIALLTDKAARTGGAAGERTGRALHQQGELLRRRAPSHQRPHAGQPAELQWQAG